MQFTFLEFFQQF